jgi:hypothetical protein
MTDLFHRVRWVNVARAGAVLLAVLLVVAWPRLKARQDDLPPALAEPVTVAGAGSAVDTPAPEADDDGRTVTRGQPLTPTPEDEPARAAKGKATAKRDAARRGAVTKAKAKARRRAAAKAAAKRRAETKAAAKRRAHRKSTTRRAKRRHHTTARRPAASTTTTTPATAPSTGGAVPTWRPPARPDPEAEFRP